jgi:hypothetical protein
MLGMFIASTALVGQNLFARIYEASSVGKYRWSIAETADRGFMVAGPTPAFGLSQLDFIMFRLNSAGIPMWVKSYSYGAEFDDVIYPSSMIRLSSGGYVLAGWAYFDPSSAWDYLVVKTDESGVVQWAKRCGGPGYDVPFSITETPDGGVAVSGYTKLPGRNEDFLIIKLDRDGAPVWVTGFGGDGSDIAYSSTMLGGGELIVAGTTNSFGAGGYDAMVISLDPNTGQFRWGITIGWNGDEMGSPDWLNKVCAITCQAGAHLILAGGTTSFGSGGNPWDIFLLKFDPGGGVIWSRVIGGFGNEAAYSVAWDRGNAFLVCGYTESAFATGKDVFVSKLLDVGELLWTKTFGGGDDDFAEQVIATSDAGCAIVGTARSYGMPNQMDLLVMKLKGDGEYPGCVSDWAPTRLDIPPQVAMLEDRSIPVPCEVRDTIIIVMDVSPRSLDACQPLYEWVDESGSGAPRGDVVVCPVSEGLVFLSPKSLPITLYSVDGQVVLSDNLRKGETLMRLKRGVYLWQAGPYRGKAVVR